MTKERLQYLLDHYFDQGLSPVEWSELEYLLTTSEQTAASFWENARWHALLRQWAMKTVPDLLPDRGKDVA